MSGKGGMGAMPVLPQNMLAVKEENPRKFYGQVCYLIWWFILLSLFIVYAAFNLKDYLETQDNPVITNRIKVAKKLTYPLFLVCPFKPLPTYAFYKYGMFVEPFPYSVYYTAYYYDDVDYETDEGNPSKTVIDVNGGVKSGKKNTGENENSNNNKDKVEINKGNTGSLFPARKNCDNEFIAKSKEEREKLTKQQNQIASNMEVVVLQSLVTDNEEPPNDLREEFQEELPSDGLFYSCVLFNAERKINDEDLERFKIISREGEGSKGCGKPSDKKGSAQKQDTGSPAKKENKKSEEKEQAYATDVGYYDGYVMIIKTYWEYNNKGEPTQHTILSLSVTIANDVDSIEATSAEYASIGLPVGTTTVIFLKRIEFICEECDDDEFVVFYNSTLNIIDMSEYPAVPKAKRDNDQNSTVVRTQIQVFFEAMTVTTQQEVITQGPLDYLGNFAGMLGTLLAFSVLGSIDRLCSYVFIGNGYLASVWDSTD